MRRPGMMRLAATIVAATLCALPAGCSEFASEKDELAYLSSPSNPTPRQWNRRQDLEKAELAIQKEQREERSKQGEERSKMIRADMKARAAKEATQDSIEAAELMAKAAEHERSSDPHLASLCYGDVVMKYPATPQAKDAAARIKAIEGK